MIHRSVCEVTVGSLAATGRDGATLPWLIVAALALATIGVVIGRRWPSSRHAAAAVVVVFALGVSLGAHPAEARAAGEVTYSEGCRLISVDQVTTPSEISLLPGDEQTVLSGTIHNLTAEPVTVSLVSEVGTALAGIVSHTTLVNDAAAERVTLPAGAAAQVAVRVSLALSQDDSAQGASAGSALKISASQ